jgi:aspartyl-tRNA(Asn)/glutamyl-tRNA(Gln) amidotransferase subunit A
MTTSWSSEPFGLTVAEAAQLLRRGELSARELTESVLARIEETDGDVRAYVRVLDDEARRVALSVDGELAAGKWRGPLHGIPFALKDVFLTAGIPTEAGSRILRGYVSDHDCGVAIRLREAGAILIGKTVTHEFAYARDMPPTRNPWNLDHYAGASSVGSGVAVAVGSAMMAMGTDTGGSVRIPASVNGVVGLKPTFGRITKFGVIPQSSTLDHCGPITRTVRDAALVLGVVAGYDSRDPTSLDVVTDDFAAGLEGGVKGLRIGVETDYFFYESVEPSVRWAAERAIAVLEELGASIIHVNIPDLVQARSSALALLLADASSYHQKWLRERGGEYHPGTRAMLEAGEVVLATDYLRALQVRRRFKFGMKEVFREHNLDAVVTPTTPITAVPLTSLAEAVTLRGETPLSAMVHHCIPFNFSGQPALSLPCGFSEEGLPIGLQIVGRPLAESLLLRMGHTYQLSTDWHRHPNPI